MAQIIKFFDDFRTMLEKNGDPRTANFPLMSSPFPTLAICLSYVYLVKVLGPRIMENRKPMELRNVLIYYNLFQVLFSTWLFYEIGMSGWLTGHYSFRCEPVDYSNHPLTIRMVHVCWWYYFSKFTEFMDTIFFVLRKKNQHVSTLHVIHHGVMPMSVWFGVKFTPGGHSTFFGFINTFVHIVMYTYYLLAAMGPKYQKFLWWKKYLTTFQMIQFIAIMVHAFQLLFIECNYPRAFVWFIGMHAVMFFFLFNEFYKQAYQKRGKSTAGKTTVQKGATTNGTITNGHVTHSKSNGHTLNGYSNNRAADYYIKASSTDLHLRQTLTTETRECASNIK
ncbi:very long chain fatty acid elongase AAEL008004-like [Periplaneta americana]|uniref:very long chain fatty acid elongase AAEL008004-like n=1 Tax=Periplaneta americana TaxID=6978 RepID=UPI0037E774E3